MYLHNVGVFSRVPPDAGVPGMKRRSWTARFMGKLDCINTEYRVVLSLSDRLPCDIMIVICDCVSNSSKSLFSVLMVTFGLKM